MISHSLLYEKRPQDFNAQQVTIFYGSTPELTLVDYSSTICEEQEKNIYTKLKIIFWMQMINARHLLRSAQVPECRQWNSFEYNEKKKIEIF